MITFDVTRGKKKSKLTMPVSWLELKFDDFVYLFEDRTEAQIIQRLTGITEEELNKGTIRGLEKIISTLSFLSEEPEFLGKNIEKFIPHTFMGLKMPTDITFEALGPYQDARNALKNLDGTVIKQVEAMPELCAIYVEYMRNGAEKYDYNNVKEIVEEVKQLPAWEVVGLGSFFIIKLYSMTKKGKQGYRPIPRPPRKFRRVFRNLVRRLGFS